jgi:hypothetical protein
MTYKLRFVQKFQENKQREFLALEQQFIALENSSPDFPKGSRYLPYAGREPSNTLIWECDFPTLQAAEAALDFLNRDPRHEVLFQQQAPYFVESFVEIYKSLEE